MEVLSNSGGSVSRSMLYEASILCGALPKVKDFVDKDVWEMAHTLACPLDGHNGHECTEASETPV